MYRQPLKQNKSLPIDQFLPQWLQELAKCRQLKLFFRDTRQRRAARDELVRCVADLLDLLRGEGVRPAFGVVGVFVAVPGCGLCLGVSEDGRG